MPLRVAIVLSLCIGLFRHARAGIIAGYQPSYEVTDHALIDLDQRLLQSLLQQRNFSQASRVYNEGAHSKSYASVILQESTGKINANTAFVGTTIHGEPITLYATDDTPAGETHIHLRYKTSKEHELYCHVGSNPAPVLDGCLATVGTIQLEGIKSKPLPYTYDPISDNQNGRTLAGFSLKAEELMAKCENCPYRDYQKFLDYYGKVDYGHEFITAAFERRPTTFDNGNVDFGTYSLAALEKIIPMATRDLNMWMYIAREFEDALDDCNKGCASDQCNAEKVNSWDEGIAFYTGSLEGRDGSGEGVLLYALADELCVEFKTCGEAGDALVGTSHVNTQIFQLSESAVKLLMAEQCDETRVYKEEIIGWMTVPLVQGLLRTAYSCSRGEHNDEEFDVLKAEAAAFASSIVPILHHCNAEDAAYVQEQLAYATDDNNHDFTAIKETLERNYECMGVTCEQVGGLWDPTVQAYRDGASPCSTPTNSSKLGFRVGVSIGTLFVLVMAASCYISRSKKF